MKFSSKFKFLRTYLSDSAILNAITWTIILLTWQDWRVQVLLEPAETNVGNTGGYQERYEEAIYHGQI